MDVVDDPMVLDTEAADSQATKSDADADTEDEGVEHGGQAAAQQRWVLVHCCSPFTTCAASLHAILSTSLTGVIYDFDVHRSRANSPTASAPSDSAAAAMDEGYARLTARQRARLEKEAGIAEDVAWHEMDLLPNLTYTWKGKGKPTHLLIACTVRPAFRCAAGSIFGASMPNSSQELLTSFWLDSAKTSRVACISRVLMCWVPQVSRRQAR